MDYTENGKEKEINLFKKKKSHSEADPNEALYTGSKTQPIL